MSVSGLPGGLSYAVSGTGPIEVTIKEKLILVMLSEVLFQLL